MSRLKYLSKLILSFLFALCLAFALSLPASAAQTRYFVQTTVDTTNWLFLASVTKDDSNNSPAKESILVPPTYLSLLQQGELVDLRSGTGTAGGYAGSTTKLVLTFPGSAGSASATAADMYRAQLVINTCLHDLNRMIDLLFPNRSGWTAETFCKKVSDILSYANSGGMACITTPDGASATIAPCDLDVSGEEFSSLRLDKSVLPEDYISVTTNGYTTYLLKRIPKGYRDIEGRETPTGLAQSPNSAEDEPEYITWNMLAWEAIHNRSLSGEFQVNENNVYSNDSPYTRNLTAIVEVLANSLRSVLNLWTVDELIFNSGSRNTTEYVGGMFPKTWESYIWAMYALFSVIALLFLLYGIIRIATSRALATANAMGQKKAWEQIRQLISVVMILTALPFLFQVFCSFSSSASDLARSMLGGETIANRRALIAKGGGLGGVVISVMFFAMDIYFNYYYAMRMLAVVVLFSIAPICVVSKFVGKGKDIYKMWQTELLVNIFIQPIHAFLLAFICILPALGRGYGQIVLMYAVIPLTSTLRTVLFGGAGREMDEAASGAAKVMTGALLGAKKLFTRAVFPLSGALAMRAVYAIRGKRQWAALRLGAEEKTIYEGVVTESTSRGYRVRSGTASFFVPKSEAEALSASEREYSRIKEEEIANLSEQELRDRTVQFQITEADEENHRLKGSVNSIQKDTFTKNLQAGQEYDGIISKTTEKGVVVNIGTGVSGFVPNRELGKDSDPNTTYAKGSMLHVRVKDIDSENDKIKLTAKLNDPWADDPWGHFVREFHKKDMTEVKVVKVLPNGAVAAIANGVNGFIPNDKAGDCATYKHDDGALFHVGDRLAVVVLKIDKANEKVRLSAKEEDFPASSSFAPTPNGFMRMTFSKPVNPAHFWTTSDRAEFEKEHGRAPTRTEIPLYARDKKTSGDPESKTPDYEYVRDVIDNKVSELSFDIDQISEESLGVDGIDELPI